MARNFERKNIALIIEYDGSAYSGWQRQAHAPSVQATIEDALAKVLKRKVVLYAAGRTDSGVSARGQVACFWGDSRYQPWQWGRILNSCLPRDIRILESKFISEAFHPQRCALSKLYEYRVLHRTSASALDRRAYFYPRPLDWERIRMTMPFFIGEKDFRAFQGAKADVRTTVRRVTRFELFEEVGGMYRFEIEGNGFLKQMVRAIIGTLIEVGEGKLAPNEIPDIIRLCDRTRAGRTAPAEGLCLVSVEYPEEFGLVLGRPPTSVRELNALHFPFGFHGIEAVH